MLNTILFDLDGTLAPFMQDDFVRLYFKALVRRLAPMGYDGEKLLAALWRGVDAMVANNGERTNRQVFWERFVADLGVAALALEGDLDDFYGGPEFDAARACLRYETDRRPLLAALREKGFGLVLATNPIFPAVAVETRLRWVGLTGGDFDYVTTYENSRHSKPDPDYYRDILAKIGKSPEECLMVGNNPVDDMAALDAGLRAYLVTDCLENPTGKAIDGFDHGSFRDLEAYLASLPGAAQ